jgi:hypothetical protein
VAALEGALASARDVESTMSRELAALREASGTAESCTLDRVTSVTREAERLKQRLRDAQAQLARLGATEGLGACRCCRAGHTRVAGRLTEWYATARLPPPVPPRIPSHPPPPCDPITRLQ